MDKTERLLNLIALLLDTRRPLTAAQIRGKLPPYAEQSDDAFKRMFERDKAEIEDLGFAIERVESLLEDMAYKISARDALLADPGLTPDEMAALSLAAQAWRGEGDESMLGLLKLSVGSTAGEPGPSAGVVPRVAADARVHALLDAIARRKVVRFSYRAGGSADARERTVEPYRLTHRGTWYLLGFDRDRQALRHFKLIRVDGDVAVAGGAAADFDPPVDLAADEPRAPWEGESMRARIAFAPESAWWVEARDGVARVADHPEGWAELEVPFSDLESFAGWITSFGAAARVLDPPELRARVVERLTAIAGSR